MVVTDLHGDWPLYQHYRNVFLELRSRELVDRWIITGDFLHSERPSTEDQSLAIALDLIELQAELGDDLIVLLGNHEMPHIYHVPLAKGDTVYTPRFEQEMGRHRETILSFLRSCPFFVRTAAGVTLAHAGGFPEAEQQEAIETLCSFSHQAVLDRVAQKLDNTNRRVLRDTIADRIDIPYAELARDFLAVGSPQSPRYDDYLIGVLAGFDEDFRLLWSALFSRNEHEGGMAAYADQVSALLSTLSDDAHRQRAVVTGHIGCRNGYRVLARGQHLRVASGAHAHPFASARYLIFDAGVPVEDAESLVENLVPTFRG